MIFMFIVPTPGKVYKERDIWVCIYEKEKRMDKDTCMTKKDHFISKMISPYTKDLLDTRG